MTSAGDEEVDAVLSDVESDEPVPIVIKDQSQEDVSVDKFREILAELDREKEARQAAEKSKSELQVSFNRLKALAHEAIKKRDECGSQRDEALRDKEEASKSNENLTAQLAEANRIKEEVMKQREDLAKRLEEASKGKDGLRSEVETSAHMLVSGIEKISGKVNSFKNFSAGGLPRSQKYTGLPSVAYGVIKRTNEIVEELVKQIKTTTKSRNEAREQIEQRNYEIAIEVSQLEATISGLREEVAKKTNIIENLEKSIAEKDGKIMVIEKEMLEKITSAEDELMELRSLTSEYDNKLKDWQMKMELQKPLLIEQLNFVSRIHEMIYDVIKIADADNMDQSDVSESFFLPQETDSEENIRACLAGMVSIYDLTGILNGKTKDLVEEKNREVKSLNRTVARLIKEKEHIGFLLRSALSRRMVSENKSKTNELFQTAENGLREAGIEFKFSKHIGDGNKSEDLDSDEDEIYTLAGALENIVKTSQLEIIELQHSVEGLRAESSVLKEHVEAQAKELNQRLCRIEDLEEKERLANESVEGLMMDIAAAEEEITRWKSAAEQEAAAGRAVEQEFLAQLSAIKLELEEAKQAMLESEKKLKFKEETAAAAMAARDAAEKSLRLADMRATRLRERVEELSRQLEEFEAQEDSRSRNRSRYVCWPWQWLGLDFVGFRKPDMPQRSSNEMELSEPLL
ncbi:E3 ubiquitin-protein ligase RGLG2-like [Hibiscus syriacus]|uniref:E3 ubiquitin-protein ligase RGLG2-like n=1 Tax=Hibiscus syriacus TaxID=106335 RepID=A0A6A3ALM9_HIBSY|nr:paramyosin-like [Hibiscus syriacus]XP_038999591.1 paramyosin-like [Hibiscus syriacus]KAE8705504.1 E3 ubiquitin-protein ligase RGLG2-like [Hibiscus syriacus]